MFMKRISEKLRSRKKNKDSKRNFMNSCNTNGLRTVKRKLNFSEKQ